MVNTKKLVVNFLILAGLTGGIIWFFSGLKSSNQLALGTQNLKIAAVDGSALDKNNSGVAKGTNLTELMAENLFEKAILDAAGYSPSSTASGGDDLLKPEEIQSLLQESISNLTPIAEEKLQIAGSDTAKDRLNYIRAVNEILRATVGSPRLNELAAQPLDFESTESAKLIFDQAVAELIKVPAPKSLLSAHQKLLTFLNQYQKILASVIDYESDPMKTIVLLDINDTLSQYNLQNFQEALKKIPPLEETAPTSFKSPSLIDELLGIKTAWAIGIPGLSDYVPVDCSGDACTDLFAAEIRATNKVTKAVKELLTASLRQFGDTKVNEELKNGLIKSIERNAMDYVQGSNTPKYVQNWQGEIQNESDRASEAVIKKTVPELCSSFNSVTKLAMGDRGVMMKGSGKPCSLEAVVPNTQDFYDDFNKGGWDGYFEALKPENNLFGSIVTLSDKASKAGGDAAQAAQAEAVAGQGFRSSKTCRNARVYTLADLKEKGVMEAGVTKINPGEESYYANTMGEDYIEGTLIPGGTEFRTCQRNGWEITTPGNVTGQILNNSLALPGQRINTSLGSKDSSTLMTVLTDSSLNRLIRTEEFGPDSQGILGVYRGTDPFKLNDLEQGTLFTCLKRSGNAKNECLKNNTEIAKLRSILANGKICDPLNPAKCVTALEKYAEDYVKNYINNELDNLKKMLQEEIEDEAKKMVQDTLCDLIPFGGAKAKLKCKLISF